MRVFSQINKCQPKKKQKTKNKTKQKSKKQKRGALLLGLAKSIYSQYYYANDLRKIGEQLYGSVNGFST